MHVETDDTAGGWAAESLHRSLRSSVILGLAAWQVVMIATVLVSSEATSSQGPLVAAHVALIALALLTRRHLVPLPVFVVALDVMMIVDWNTAVDVNAALALSTAWMCNLAQMFPAMLMTGWQSRFYATLIGVGVPLGLYLVHPEWLDTLVIPAFVTGLAIRFIGRRAVPVLDAFARRVDGEASASERELRAVASNRAASRASAEQARVLHDTVINTLAAVASGGGAVRDVEQVRARCRRDAHTLELLLDGLEALPATLDLASLTAGLGIQVSRSGLTAEEVEQISAGLDEEVVRSLAGSVREALINVAKHAGTSEAEVVFASVEGRLEIAVVDRGRGFDGAVVPGRGLAESVVARAADAGVAVVIDSSPGRGSEVRLTAPLAPPTPTSADEPPADFTATVLGIRGRAGWLWVVGVIAVGVVIECVNRFGVLSPTYGMLGVLVVAGLTARAEEKRRGGLGFVGLTVVLASVPAAYLLAFAGTDFGEGAVINWQCLGASVPLILLLDHGRGRLPFVAGVLTLVATAGAATAVLVADSGQLALLPPVGMCPALVIAGGWVVFHRALERVGRRAAREQAVAAGARLELAQRQAAATSRERWRQAGLRDALSLLVRIGDGSLDPASDVARAACVDEEAYLRQVTLLNPDLFRMGYQFSRGLALARSQEVRLTVRAGEHDVESDETAAVLGTYLEDAVAAAAPGSEITVSLFPSRGRLRLGLVGPSPLATAVDVARRVPPGWAATVQRFGDTDIVEVVRLAEPDGRGAVEVEDRAESGRTQAA